MRKTINGNSLPNIPWEEKPKECSDVIWRFSGNPIIDRNPVPKAARVYNSAIVPYKGEFAGVFRADQKNGRATLFAGFSKDAIKINLDQDPIEWINEDGTPNPTSFAYDPRVVNIDDTYYILWCDDMNGPSIGLGRTIDFKTF
ncbi:MAG: glycosylase, partial [Ignavibacteriae bacterium]|nr:glycosylase [Ignavibacteriota bacterium]